MNNRFRANKRKRNKKGAAAAVAVIQHENVIANELLIAILYRVRAPEEKNGRHMTPVAAAAAETIARLASKVFFYIVMD